MTSFFALSEGPLSALLASQTSLAGITTFYFSDRGFTTGGSETPADTHFEGRIAQAPVFERSIVRAGSFFGGRVIRSTGNVALSNADGMLDQLPDTYAIDGRAVRIKIGGINRDAQGIETPWPYADFVTLLAGAGLGWSFTEDRLRLSIRANDALLEIPFQTETYGGTGGADGDADLKGSKKPRAYGRLENISPVLIDQANLIYQFHDRDVSQVSAVYDRGVALTAGVDRADYVALAANDPGAGKYDTALAAGLLRLSSPPAGGVTLDCRGDAFGGYVETTADVVARWMGLAGVSNALTASGAVESFNAGQAGPVGYYLRGGTTTFAQALDALVGGASGFWGFGGDGKLVLRRVEAPVGGEVFGSDEILTIERLTLPYGLPHFRISVGYRPAWTVQGDADIAAGADETHARFVSEPYRFAESVDSSVKTKHLLARDPPFLPSFFALEADAQAEADRLMALYKEDRRLFRLVLKHRGLNLAIGSTIKLKHPRWGLSSARSFAVVGLRHDLNRNQIEVRCFG